MTGGGRKRGTPGPIRAVFHSTAITSFGTANGIASCAARRESTGKTPTSTGTCVVEHEAARRANAYAGPDGEMKPICRRGGQGS